MDNFLFSFLKFNIIDDIKTSSLIKEDIKSKMIQRIKKESDYNILHFSIYREFPESS